MRLRRTPRSRLFPYTTLFRSLEEGQAFEAEVVSGVERRPETGGGEVNTAEVPEDDVHFATAGLRPSFHTTDRKSTRLNSSHRCNSYAVFRLKKKNASHNQKMI